MLTIYKVGGSLLETPGLVDLVQDEMRRRPESAALVVVGGGLAADAVRRWDVAHGLGDERSHWLALEAMRLNEALLQELWPGLREVRSASQALAAANDGVVGLLCSSCFCRWAEAAGWPALPHTWGVTSDSIAAWAATILDAELVLFKSVDLLHGCRFEDAARQGLVDEHFPHVAKNVRRIGWVNAHGERNLADW